MNLELNPMIIEISLHLLPVYFVDVEVCDSQAPIPSFVTISKVAILDIEDAIDEGEVVFDLLISFNMKSSMARGGFGLFHSCFKVRHVEAERSEDESSVKLKNEEATMFGSSSLLLTQGAIVIG
jgi:hypothetical protein